MINEAEHEYVYRPRGRGLLKDLKKNSLYIGDVKENPETG